MDASVPTITACNTCRAAFPNTEKLKDHYRGEWHAFNSKRRSSELAPLSLKEFAVYVSSKPAASQKKKATPSPVGKAGQIQVGRPTSQGPLLSRTAMAAAAAEAEKAKQLEERIVPEPSVAIAVAADAVGWVKEGKGARKAEGAQEGEDEDAWTDASGEEEDEFEEEMDEAALLAKKIAANISIFDDKVCRDAVSCVDYMEQTFGFFIPDVECLVDLPGLILYLGQKVKLGGFCLYCQKQFEPGRACQNHMMSKSHCKIAYEEGVDMSEFESFYDYDLLSDDGKDSDDDTELEVSAIGELIMSNKTVGHRSYARYYKQKFRPEDTRVSILAQKREQVFRLSNMYGSGVTKIDETSLMKLSDAAVAGVLAKQHKEILKVTKMQQRAQQRFEFRTKRTKEYKSTVDKLRSHQTTTDKIQDYHGRLQ